MSFTERLSSEKNLQKPPLGIDLQVLRLKSQHPVMFTGVFFAASSAAVPERLLRDFSRGITYAAFTPSSVKFFAILHGPPQLLLRRFLKRPSVTTSEAPQICRYPRLLGRKLLGF
ncbi:hypothetical protein [Paenibacillus sp. J2TS4]|uniref:hypothetical protein n=1 Tax=Paenibacillus sp. J2TS4 TaxID=2807194 RepID=UPI001BCB3A11|nr:hypothetical protein [Paenibacillus sp. J2TS4]